MNWYKRKIGLNKEAMAVRSDGLYGLGNASWENHPSESDVQDAIDFIKQTYEIEIEKCHLVRAGLIEIEDLPGSNDWIDSKKGSVKLPTSNDPKSIEKLVNDLSDIFQQRRYHVYGAVQNAFSKPDELPLEVTEDLGKDSWGAVVKGAHPFTAEELAELQKRHTEDPDGKGKPFYFMVRDLQTGEEKVSWQGVPQLLDFAQSRVFGKAKGLPEEQLDFSPEKVDNQKSQKEQISKDYKDIVHSLFDGKLSPVIAFEDYCIANGRDKVNFANALNIPVLLFIIVREK